jgi:DNA invertase Pin-like site-specific DNA recombinase
MQKVIVYYRVSTVKQEASGLGLEGQRAAVESYLAQQGGVVVGEYTEIESGSKDDRPQLKVARAMCKAMQATLLVARMDRLARDVHFLSGLLKEGVTLAAADMPNASTLVWHVRAAVAQEERRLISERTKAALAAAKRRGKQLGWAAEGRRAEAKAASEKGAAKGGAKSGLVRAAEADAHARAVWPVVQDMVAGGASLRQVAAALNERGITTPRGKAWAATSVRNLLERVAA